MKKIKEEDLYGAQNTMSDLLPLGHELSIFSREIHPLFTDGDFKDCYSTRGRNGKSPAFLAMVTILQWRESLSDIEAREAVSFRLDWKYALHLPVDSKEAFDASTLCVFRRRLKVHGKERLIFEKLLDLCKEKGFIKKRTKQRIDATHIIKHNSRIATTDLLYRAVKCVVEEIEALDPEYFEANIPKDIQERYEGKFSSFGMSKEKRADKQAELVEDGIRLEQLLQDKKSDRLTGMKQMEIMKTIFRENVIVKEKVVEEKIFIEVDEIEGPKQTIFDPRDPSLQMGRKGKLSWVGEKCHIVETAEKGDVNFITDMIPQKAVESDQKIHTRLQESNKMNGLEPEKIFTDQNYISGAAIKDYEEKGQKLMGYLQKDSSNKPDGFRFKDFLIDTEKQEAICPNGCRNCGWGYYEKGGYYHVRFSKSDCGICPFRGKCITSNDVRILTIRKDYEQMRKRREEQNTDEFKKEMSVRAQVEGTISEMVRFYGLRHIKYKGEKGRLMQYYCAATALNLKHICKKLGPI